MVSVSRSCCNKLPHAGCLPTTGVYRVMVLQSGGRKSRRQQSGWLARTPEGTAREHLFHASLLASNGGQQSLVCPGLWMNRSNLCFYLHVPFCPASPSSLLIRQHTYWIKGLLGSGMTSAELLTSAVTVSPNKDIF